MSLRARAEPERRDVAIYAIEIASYRSTLRPFGPERLDMSSWTCLKAEGLSTGLFAMTLINSSGLNATWYKVNKEIECRNWWQYFL